MYDIMIHVTVQVRTHAQVGLTLIPGWGRKTNWISPFPTLSPSAGLSSYYTLDKIHKKQARKLFRLS